jgi:RNA polymerase sigma-70 factor (ECF subfamily)
MGRTSDPAHYAPFPSTHWSLLLQAGEGDAATQRAATEMLLLRYYPALLTHLTGVKRVPRPRAEDLLQGFVASKVLAQALLARARKSKGRFRTFLLSALDRYAISEFRRDTAQKRCPEALVPLDEVEPCLAAGGGAAREVDVEWARAVIREALLRMRTQCQAQDRADLWRVFEERLLRPALTGAKPPPYENWVKEAGLASPADAYNLLITAKRLYVRLLETVIGEYASDRSEIREEIRDLFAVLSGAGAE